MNSLFKSCKITDHTDYISDFFADAPDTASAVMQVSDNETFHGIDDSFSTNATVGSPVETRLAEKFKTYFLTSLYHDKIREKHSAYFS